MSTENKKEHRKYIEIYTDGSYDMRKKRGGWGCYMELNFSKKGIRGYMEKRKELLLTD